VKRGGKRFASAPALLASFGSPSVFARSQIILQSHLNCLRAVGGFVYAPRRSQGHFSKKFCS
jgi:hypothetical protein